MMSVNDGSHLADLVGNKGHHLSIYHYTLLYGLILANHIIGGHGYVKRATNQMRSNSYFNVVPNLFKNKKKEKIKNMLE